MGAGGRGLNAAVSHLPLGQRHAQQHRRNRQVAPQRVLARGAALVAAGHLEAVGRQWAVGSEQWAVGSGRWAVSGGQWAVGTRWVCAFMRAGTNVRREGGLMGGCGGWEAGRGVRRVGSGGAATYAVRGLI